MSQRSKMMTQVLGYQGWRITEAFFERADGTPVEATGPFQLSQDVRLVLQVERRWAPRCSGCGAICGGKAHEQLEVRRWNDLPWAGRPVQLAYAPIRVRCRRCKGTPQELLAFAERYQRQTKRLQQHLALDAASAPISHVAAHYGLDWSTVRRAELHALERWDQTRKPALLRQVGVDEKYLGRRGKHPEDFVTIISNNETGEPLWIGYGRSEATVAEWLATLTKEAKQQLELFVMDMHRAFLNAVQNDQELAHVVVVHDPFHVMKRVGSALDELRREMFFRAGPELRAAGRGKRWLYLRAWENMTEDQRIELKALLSRNRTLARGYEIAEEIRAMLHAPTADAMGLAITHILLRTQRREPKALRSLHDSIERHAPQFKGLATHHPATGRVEALNTNWEALIRRGRGYRDLHAMLLRLRFMIVNPIAREDGVRRFLALGLPAPLRRAS
jgi:transposase